ncbi:calcium-transporting ATPase 1 [bacterium BMS3Bbin10]|nr:calcium-transporting ATPase 1 [bacterium BMS3Bbin10]
MTDRTKQPVLPENPHALPAGKVLAQLGVSPQKGLTSSEARARLAAYGHNALRARKTAGLLPILLNQFMSPVVALLAAAALIAFIFGEWKEAAAIAAVLAVNAAIGFTTELRAVRSMEALRTLATIATRVRRDGRLTELPAEQLVPGDIVVLEGGDVVTADLRLVEASNMAADESTLTGESLAVAKNVRPVAAGEPLAERTPMAFKGTSITRGSGLGVVVATGMQSELGRISRLVEEARPEHSPLERQLERLSGHLIIFTVVIVAIIGALGIASGKDVFLMVEAAIALAVAAIPEGLPIVATMALARGMWRMARHNALIERLAAVETLGATTVIFTDKTGTLTENRMVLSELWLTQARVHVRTKPPGFLAGNKRVTAGEVAQLDEALSALVLCNNAELADRGKTGTGDPLEVALLQAGRIAGKEKKALLRRFPKLREVAFDSESKMMATVHRAKGGFTIYVKGAPEAVLEHATHFAGPDGVRKLGRRQAATWLKRTDMLAEQGMRILAVAMKKTADADEPAYSGLTFLGLLGLHDPPRSDVSEAIRNCRDAGIRVIMITGDHAVTARNIAAAVCLSGPDARVIEGRQLKAPGEMSKRDLRNVLSADVFARVSPGQKLDLVSIYQDNGEIVAMTGDGVNDAPALKKADIGVAMGLRGTQVAREAAAMVLRDDAFSSIVTAIREGRVIFRNIQSFVTYLLSCNLSEILIVGLAILAGLPLPLLPLQILFLNLVTDVFPAFALGVGEGDRQVLKRRPRDPKLPIITPKLWAGIIGHGLSITLATLGALFIARTVYGLEGEQAVTVSFLTLAFAQLWHVFNMRDARAGMFVNAVTRNKFVWGALALCTAMLVAVIYVPFAAELLHLRRPDPSVWGLILGMSFAPVIVGQTGKEVAAFLSARRSNSK